MTRFYLFTIFVLLIACKNGKNKPDVSDIKVDLRIERFEQAFFKIDTNNIPAGLADLRNGFPRFYPVFMRDILQLNPMDTNSFGIIKALAGNYRPINDSIQKKYKNLDWLKDELTEGFKYVKHYFPDYRVPGVITFIATFDAPGIILTQDHLGIGLHQYAGKNFSVYQVQPIMQMYPSYISRRFDKEYMTANCMKAITDDVYPDKSVGRPLIEQMIEKGKQWFLLDKFLPDAADSVKTGYTKKAIGMGGRKRRKYLGLLSKKRNGYLHHRSNNYSNVYRRSSQHTGYDRSGSGEYWTMDWLAYCAGVCKKTYRPSCTKNFRSVIKSYF